MPVLNETWSLEQTVDILMQENFEVIKEIVLIIHPKKTISESLQSIAKVETKYPDIIRIGKQELPFVGGAIRKGFEIVCGYFTVMMACDLETDPHLVKTMIAKIKEEDLDIVATSRWIKGGGFGNYAWWKKVCNCIFQKMFNLLYLNNLTDMTYGFRVFKTEILKKIKWTSLNHEIFFETLLKPLRLDYSIKEIPAQWSARQEGESQIRLFYFLKYFAVGFITRFVSKNKIMAS